METSAKTAMNVNDLFLAIGNVQDIHYITDGPWFKTIPLITVQINVGLGKDALQPVKQFWL